MESLIAILNDPAILFVDTYFDQFEEGSVEAELLALFAYQNWEDYQARAPSLPVEYQFDSSSQAIKKIKKLTLLSILATEQTVDFATLMEKLSLDNYVDLESLVIDLMASEVIDARIDEQTQTIVCTRCSARCVHPDKESIMKRVEQIRKIRANIENALEISNPN